MSSNYINKFVIIRQLTEAKYDLTGQFFSEYYTIVDMRPEHRAAPYVFLDMAYLKHEKHPRRSSIFQSKDNAEDFLAKKRRYLNNKIQKRQQELADRRQNPNNRFLSMMIESREGWDAVKIIHVRSTYV